MEGMTGAGSTVCEGGTLYARKHDPFIDFMSTNPAMVVPGHHGIEEDTATNTVPDFWFYSPNLENDAHNGCYSCANSTLEFAVKRMQATSWYAEGGRIIVTFDENGESGLSAPVATVVVSNASKGLPAYTANGNHYGTLASIEDLFGVPRLGNAAGATTLAPLLGTAEPPPKEEPPLEEPPKEEPPLEEPSTMKVGLDIGGWVWESAINDEAGAVKYVRSSFTHFSDDTHMERLAKAGVTLLPLFGEGGTIAGYDTSTFVNEIVAWFHRYGKGGSFWAGKTDLGATTAELVNEPGNPNFYPDCCSTAGHEAYADLTRKVHSAFAVSFPESIRPKTLVSYDGGYNGSAYGEAVFAAGAVADAVDVHPYGGHTSRELSGQGHRDKVEQAHAKTGLPVYVSELGWPTCGETGDSLNWSESEQAENITSFAAWARGTGYVAAFVSFNYADYGANCYGIVKAAGSPHKLSYEALKHA
jgi:hypothetical protein